MVSVHFSALYMCSRDSSKTVAGPAVGTFESPSGSPASSRAASTNCCCVAATHSSRLL